MSWNFKLRHWWILGAASIIQYILVGYGCIGKCDGTPPESQLLKMQRFYSRENPHDNRLYTTLGVLSNATASDITKAYRLRSRELHPDKRSHFSKSQNDAPLNEDGNAAVGPDLDEELELVRQAYDILKDDRTRLLYHKYGLLDTSTAAMILTGGILSSGKSSSVSYSDRWNTLTADHQRLLQLMGYHDYRQKNKFGQNHKQRVLYIATNLVELLRPLVEGIVSQQDFAHQISTECQSLKSLPLGAQIIRCIGRAYRRSGQRYLKRHQRYYSTNNWKKYPKSFDVVSFDVTDGIRDTLRNVQHIATAAVASGKLLLKQQQNTFRKQMSKLKKTLPSIAYYNDIDHVDDYEQFLADIFGEDDEYEVGNSHSKDIKREEQDNAEGAIISTMQVEALWKISKIELDRTIQEACDVILRRHHFFFPDHYQRQMYTYKPNSANNGLNSDSQVDHVSDGWVVSSTGKVIETDVGRLRAAAALVLVGDILVQCSKDGTSWRK